MSSTQLRPVPNPSPEPTVCVGRLFEAYSDRIYAFCLRRLGCPSDAEDSVQMTFLCAHRAVQRGVVPGSESAWLFAIAKNVCRWQQRTTFRRNRLLTDADLDSLASSPSDDVDDERLDGLKDALAAIPESQQRALVLREWHGLSSSQVAAQLGMSPPATYALLTRARRSLAHALTALPQQAALGLATLVYELRSHVKALFGGSAVAKTVAATTVVAVVAVGGVSAQRIVSDRGAPQTPQSGVVGADAVEAQRVGVSSEAVRESGSTRAADSRSGSPPTGPAAGESGAAPGDAPMPTSTTPGGVVPPQQLEETVAAATDLVPIPGLVPELPPLPGLLPELPPLPVPTLPTDLLPPAPELPPAPSVPVPDSVPQVDPSALPPPPDPELPDLLP